ncbi:hypothetical protein A0H81_10662 [Grifola frondosa]|uniref:Uncharacterized protein n=1 Tax=Grifola frondosa TaxID=5627 RepID=A0A1C7LXQ1_GRIFR|nr:hypothetical protein A0H81_10662 [Grifola frondosa]
MITMHMIFGVLIAPTTVPTATRVLTLEPANTKAHGTPMQIHPSKCARVPDTCFCCMSKYVRDAHDPVHATRSRSCTEGMQWSTYFMLPTEQGPLYPSMISSLADSAMGFNDNP